MAAEIYLPKMSDHMEEGKILRWLVKEGEAVERGQVLLEIETDKAIGEIEAPAKGILQGVTARDGETVPVGIAIGYILKPGETRRGQPAAAVTPAGSEAPEAIASTASAPSAAPAATSGGITPAAPAARRVAKELGVDISKVAGTGPGGRVKEEDVRAFAAEAAASVLAASPAAAVDGIVPATPVARKVAKDLGVDLNQVTGTGPGGRVKEDDVRAFAASRQAAPTTPPAPPVQFTPPVPPTRPTPPAPVSNDGASLQLTHIQKITGERMQESVRQAPHFFLQVAVNMAEAQRLVEMARPRIQSANGARLSLTAVLVKALALTLKKHPRLNSSFENGALRLHPVVNIGVAVGAQDNLVVPVIKQADAKPLADIAAELNAFQGKAAEMRFSPEDLSGGTFTLSNLGMYGVDVFTAIINPPQSAILAVGRVVSTPVGRDDGSIVLEPRLTMTLSADHRSLDGLQGARFLAELKSLLEQPYLML